jgi:alpha-ketoglutarate-dependent taurine dioxygenase
MSTPPTPNKPVRPAPPSRRKSVSLSQTQVISAAPLQPGSALPLLVQPVVDGLDLIAWAQAQREFIEAELTKHGGILFRHFDLDPIAGLEQFVSATASGWAEYREPATPRSQVKGNIYTSTDYPPAYPIFLHNENSHTESWPLKIYFACVLPAARGGETPIADCRRIFESLDPQIRDRFVQKKVMYVRNFGEGMGFTWQAVFKTSDRADVEQYCHENGIRPEWRDGDRLRIRYVRPAVARHPRSGDMVWFNHATFFHVSTLEPALRESLLATVGEADLPYNTYYGDGSAIEAEVLEALRAAYRQATVLFPWQTGDLLMLDNMLVAHGRSPFAGPRKIVVGMAETCHWDDLPPPARL